MGACEAAVAVLLNHSNNSQVTLAYSVVAASVMFRIITVFV